MKTPFHFAASELDALMDRIDQELEKDQPASLLGGSSAIDIALVPFLEAKRLELAEAVDRRIYFFQYLEDQIERGTKNKEQWAGYVKRLKDLYDRIEDRTIETIRAHPDLSYKGEAGQLKVQLNGSAKLITSLLLTNKSVSNIVDLDQIEKEIVSAEYLKKITYVVLDKDKVMADLKKGVQLPWARLEKGFQLRSKIV